MLTLDGLSRGEHCAVTVLASGRIVRDEANVGMARHVAARRGHLGGHLIE